MSSLLLVLDRNFSKEKQTELVRKTIHLSIAFVPFLASINKNFTLALLAFGVLLYSYSEYLRCKGVKVFLISNITALAARERDSDNFVLGPVTLGLGAMMALLFYPEPAAAAAIYALAFGDGLASLVGKFFGTVRPTFLFGKSVEGSLACFFAVYLSSYTIFRDPAKALVIAITATFLEALPLKDLDNLVIPAVTGSLVVLLMAL